MAIFDHVMNGEDRGIGSRQDANGNVLRRASVGGHILHAIIFALENGLRTQAEIQSVYEFDAADQAELNVFIAKYRASSDKSKFLEGVEVLRHLRESDKTNLLGIGTKSTFLEDLDSLG